MRRSSFVRAGLLLLGLLPAVSSTVYAQAIQLRYAPPVGQVTHYRIASRQWSSVDTSGAPLSQSALYQTQTILPMDGPNHVIRMTFDSTVMSGAAAGRDAFRGWSFTIHQDPSGTVLSTEVTPAPGIPGFMAGMIGKSLQSSRGPNNRKWPEGSISPGYTWSDSMPMSYGSGRNAKQAMCHLTYKFDRVDHQGGAQIAVFPFTAASAAGEACSGGGEIAFDIDGSRVAHSMTDMTIAGQAHVKQTMETLP
ncbi:MAG: hypothetical protein ABSG61_08095 [Gemmatimonadales bacterium]|jgi:hypothetical protein